MTEVEQLAAFVVATSYDDISQPARTALKTRVLDALGCAIGALDSPPVIAIRVQLDAFGGEPLATLIGGGRTAPDRASFYNGALIRYLDFNDSYLATGETCHPSDTIGAMLAASESAERSGKDLLTALAVAYQVQCRLTDVAPVRARGFDHTTQGAYAVAAGVSKALGSNLEQTAHAIAISGSAYTALRVTRTGRLSNWKGLAYANMACGATHAAFLAARGITGPLEIFEGNKGFKDAIAGPFVIDWSRESLDAVRHTILKKYNAEIHSQSALEGILEMRQRYRIDPRTVERVELDVFEVAYHIIGGGDEGDKRQVLTKEDADHNLRYMVAAALLDGKVTPAQYTSERILRDDVQTVLSKVVVRPDASLTRGFPGKMPVRIRVVQGGGATFALEKQDYEGFHTRPMSWETVIAKFDNLAAPFAEPDLREAIVAAVYQLESLSVRQLTELLGQVRIRRTT